MIMKYIFLGMCERVRVELHLGCITLGGIGFVLREVQKPLTPDICSQNVGQIIGEFGIEPKKSAGIFINLNQQQDTL